MPEEQGCVAACLMWGCSLGVTKVRPWLLKLIITPLVSGCFFCVNLCVCERERGRLVCLCVSVVVIFISPVGFHHECPWEKA